MKIDKAIILAALIAGLLLSGCSTAQKPGAVAVEEITATAEIANIDYAKRTVTIRLSNGATRSYAIGNEVKNFDQINVGDVVRLTALESIAVFVRKTSEQPGVIMRESVSVASKGKKPGIFVTETFELIARIVSIDNENGYVTLKSPDGNIKTFAFQKSEGSFKNVKAGDDVVLNVTVAVMVAVEKPSS